MFHPITNSSNLVPRAFPRPSHLQGKSPGNEVATVGVGFLGLTADCGCRLIAQVQPSVALETYLEEVQL